MRVKSSIFNLVDPERLREAEREEKRKGKKKLAKKVRREAKRDTERKGREREKTSSLKGLPLVLKRRRISILGNCRHLIC